MAKKHKHAEHVNHERWLVSYADFITLLFAFFVVMFAASNTDQQKAGKVAKAVEIAFTELGMFEPSSKVVPLYDDGGLPGSSHRLVGSTNGGFDSSQIVQSASSQGPARDRREMQLVQEHLSKELAEEIKAGGVEIKEDSRGLTVSLSEAGFFAPGSSALDPAAATALARIAETVKGLSAHVRIEGHTDNTPIHTAQFPSNWELSTSRATNVLRYLTTTAGIPPERLSAAGYGEYRPVAPNDSIDGRRRNRRVDLVLLNAATQKQEPSGPEKAAETVQETASQKH